MGFKLQHAADALAAEVGAAWIELHPETYMVDGGPRLRVLDALAERYPISLHGVALSLAGARRPDPEHLRRLRALADRTGAAQVSEHLAWSDHKGVYTGDLLPVALTEATLAATRRNVEIAQEALGRRILVENPAHYLRVPGAELAETQLLVDLARTTGCGLLVDVNNIFVTDNNVGVEAVGEAAGDAGAYVDALPAELIGEVHLAGHKADPAAGCSLLIDTHGAPVAEGVWALYDRLLRRIGPRPTLIEWDTDVPSWKRLVAEAARAETMLADRRSVLPAPVPAE